MDQRITLEANEKFDHLLQTLKDKSETARVLFDSNGLERAEGAITTIDTIADEPFFILNEGKKILISSLIGVNGVFKSDYSEC